MTYLLFIIYFLFFCWLTTRIPFIKKSGLSTQWIIGLFTIKVAAGIAYGWFYEHIPNYTMESDSWKFFFEGKQQTQLLLTNPIKYFNNTFDNPYGKEYRRFFATANSYWNDLKHIYMVKLVSIFNLFSGSRYYVNVIFYSFITFFGPIAFLRIMNDVFPGKLKILTIGTFLLPSFLFWSSGIHKDGLVFTLLTVSAFIYYFSLKEKSFTTNKALLIGLLLLLILLVRNHIVLAAIPGFFAWWLAEKYFTQKWIAFALVTIIGITIFFTSKYIHPKLDLPISIMLRQKDFVKLGGKSFLPQRELKSNFGSFLINAPQALNHTMARPYLSEIESPLYLLSAMELAILWLLIFIWFFRFTDNPYRHSVVMFFFLISMALLLLTGYIVPQLGAIVRYRSIFLPLLVVPILATSKWTKNILQ